MIQSKPLIKRTASECLIINSDKNEEKQPFSNEKKKQKKKTLKNCAFLAEYRIIQKYNLKNAYKGFNTKYKTPQYQRLK